MPRFALVAASLLLLACHTAHAGDRVKEARANQQEELAALFATAHLAYPPKEILLRAFKDEGELELWASGKSGAPMTLVTTFSICMRSGDPGPKRQLGDGQVPEGFYRIDRFNPTSNFHLSLGLNYPNDSDRVLGVKGQLGGDIFIHGSCVTVGCLPIRDHYIEQLYLIALDARAAGQKEIPVHVFPRRMDERGMERLKQLSEDDPKLWAFWQWLLPGYRAFEQTRRPPKVSVNPKTGAYIVSPVIALAR